MQSRIHKELNLILHPFQFILKEGIEIDKDFFDYSLLMIQVGCQEIIRSPLSHKGTVEVENELEVVMRVGKVL